MNRHLRSLTSALQYQTSGRLDQAERIYRRILRDDSGNPDALHLLGLVAFQQGDNHGAARHIARAIQVRPGIPEYHCSLGNVLKRAGRPDQALLCYQAALSRKPDYADAHVNLGNCLQDLGNPGAAVPYYLSAIEYAPGCAVAFNNLGNASMAIGQTEQGIAFLQHAIQLQPDYSEARVNLAVALSARGRHSEALLCCREAIRLNPRLSVAHATLASILFEMDRKDEAGAAWEQVLRLDPQSAEACCNLAAVRLCQNQPEAAEDLARRAVRIRPEYPQALNTLGQALLNQFRVPESRVFLEKAIELSPAAVEPWRNLAHLHVYMGDPEGAERCYREAIRLNPSDPHTHFNYSLALLSMGRFEEGWREYEWRRRMKDDRWPLLDCPVWDGGDLQGRTILVRAEQGLGDTVQFLRYLPMLKARGGRVVFECQPRLVPLIEKMNGCDEVVGFSEERPPSDVYTFLMSLPHHFQTTSKTIPSDCPYIRPDSALLRTWGERLGTLPGFRVGLSWAGDATNPDDLRRSLPFSALEPLFDIPGVSWVSLQRGEPAWQLACSKWTDSVRQLETESTAIVDTAAIVANLDLVVSADTMVAHLSGALGIQTWLLLCAVPDWRWMRARADSPWYPAMRIFRQSEPGDWGAVARQVRTALALEVELRTEDAT